MPAIEVTEGGLRAAYLVSNSKSGTEHAVIYFDGVLQHTFGYPNDEALGGHPLYKFGLNFYAINLVHNSPVLDNLGSLNAKTFPGSEKHFLSFNHWIVSFHDETLEVIGRSIEFIGTCEVDDSKEALRRYGT
ncbi:MAG: hypothetical protein AAF431_07500 [Pseudomonadota bacterium]